MSPRRLTIVAVAAAGVLLASGVPILAQIPPAMPTRLTLQGTIQAFAPGKIQVLTPTGQQWIIHLSSRTSAMLTGKADAGFLQPGMYVKFRTNIAGHQKAAGPIETIQVFTPTRQDVPGVFPVAKAAPAPDTKPAGVRKADVLAAAETYDVVGRITAIQRGKLVVSYGSGTLQVEPAAHLDVGLALADIRFAKPGDRIVCVADRMELPSARAARASSIQIYRSQPVKPPGQSTPPGQLPADTGQEAPSEEPGPAPGGETEGPGRLVELLTLKGDKVPDEQFVIEGDPTEFRPCVRRSATSLRRDFGPPVRTPVRGTLTVRGRERRGTWQMWTWGIVKVIVDRSQKTRFLAVEQEPQSPPARL